MSKKRVCNLYDEILARVAEVEGEPDSRFRHWVKRVDSVDQNKTSGYAFAGEFINEGTVEVEIKPSVYLVKTVRGSRKYQTATYNVVVMDQDGNLTLTDIRTTDTERGWALRIRDKVAEMVNQQANAPQTVTVELTGPALEFLTTLRARIGGNISDAEIIGAALSLYEMHTSDRA